MMIVEQMLKNAQTPLLHIADVSGSALFQGDCLEIMPLIPDKSVQLILADLPFNTEKRTTWNDWDKKIDLIKLWENYDRVLVDNGCVILFGYGLFAHQLALSSKAYKYDLIWQKNRGTGFLNCKRMPLSDFENILIFYNKQCTYNPQMKEGKPYKITKGSLSSNYAKTDKIVVTENEGLRYPTRILNFANEPKPIHPTQKPLELIKYLILTYSNENDMVLDNTMGSGTTCLGAKELNRHFIGIEKEVKYYDLAVERVFPITQSIYKNIQTKENYDKLLSSGMFWEFHPELSGNWDVDRYVVQHCH